MDELVKVRKEVVLQKKEKSKLKAELALVNKKLAIQKKLTAKRANELSLANKKIAIEALEREKSTAKLITANKKLASQNKAKEKRAAELVIANKELRFQTKEKEKRAAELITANKKLASQNKVKAKRALELVIANEELAFQNEEKEKRAAELFLANKELAFQNKEKEKRAAELFIANKELVFQTGEKEKRAAELVIADIELTFQNKEKDKREIANKELETLSRSLKLASTYSRSLLEASLDLFVTISIDGKITDVNKATLKVTGIEREQLIGTNFSNYFSEPAKAEEGYRQAFDKGFVSNYPLTIKHKNGKLTDVLYNASVYKDDLGLVLGVFAAARDITIQKRIEKELIDAKVFAESATGIAEEAQLKAENAMRIAEDAVRAKQQFLSNMSHEIRTPMNAIIGFTKVVLRTDLTDKQKEYLTAIKISGNALIVLINDILDLAKVDAGKMTFEQTPFKMAASISAMLHLFEPKVEEKNLQLIKQYDDRIPDVLVGDPVRLHQIILNLVSNAVKFTSKGKITVKVVLLEEDAEKVNIEFSVADTGIGIADNKIEKIFGNFQQATSGTGRLYGGTGLGLAIVKQLVEPQGGTVQVKSKLDEGSVFSFALKFLKTKADAEVDAAILDLDHEIKDIKILVVEDMALNQLLMKTLLDDFGFDGDIAANGRIAIEMLNVKDYDIILMDLQMPEMNGFEATEHIRKKLKSDVPIIALTADVTTMDLAKCKAVGMNDYIAKPVDERLLYSKIVGLVKKTAPSVEQKEVIDQLTKEIRYIDLKYLNQRTKSNPILMMEMITLYLEQTPPLVRAMRQSLQDQDWMTLHATVHKMIPSFSIMGIHLDFENMAKQVQEYANSHLNMEGIPTLVSKLESVCTQACLELKEELDMIKKNVK